MSAQILNTMNKHAHALLVFAALLAGTSQAQQTTSTRPSVRDNPGLLGMSYGDLGLSLERIRGAPEAAYTAGISVNRPIAPGVDLGLGYDYWWYNYSAENSHFSDSRYHLLGAEAKFYRPGRGVKPFVSTLLGYQWSRGSYSGYVITPEGSTTTATTPPGGTTSIVTTPVAPTTTTTTSTTTTSAVTTPTSNNTSGVIYGPGEATTSTTVYDSTSSALTYLTASERSNRAVWGLGFGFEVPMGALAITPRVTYTDTMEAGSDWAYHYGAEIHHWFNETAGFYADVTFNDPRVLPASWSYFAGLRFRF